MTFKYVLTLIGISAGTACTLMPLFHSFILNFFGRKFKNGRPRPKGGEALMEYYYKRYSNDELQTLKQYRKILGKPSVIVAFVDGVLGIPDDFYYRREILLQVIDEKEKAEKEKLKVVYKSSAVHNFHDVPGVYEYQKRKEVM
jgi:hypothetical protein